MEHVRALLRRLESLRQPQYLLAAVAAIVIAWTAMDTALRSELPVGPEASEAIASDGDPAHSTESFSVRPASYLEGAGLASNAGLIGTITIDEDCAEGGSCGVSDETCDESMVTRHQRADYVVEPPDILSIVVHADRADAELLDKINGEHLVEPDGSVCLGDRTQKVHVSGLTLGELPGCLHEFLQSEVPDAEVCVSVFAQNSKVYYILSQNDAGGDTVARYPALGGETVRTALGKMAGVDWSDKHVWIARPVADGGTDEVLPIDAEKVLSGSDTATDYTLEPGDRVFIANPPNMWEVFSDAMSSVWSALFEGF